MCSFGFLLVSLLFAIVAQITSAGADAEDVDLEFFWNLPNIGPRIDMRNLPRLYLPEERLINSGIKGHLLSPKEGCGISKAKAPRIVGGSPAKPGQYPWMALLGFSSDGLEVSFKCGGSLISSRHVLTAAHCVNHALYMVRLGAHDFTTSTDHEDVRVSRSVSHSEFDKSLMINDIAILHLNRDVQFNDKIRPICLNLDGQSQSFEGRNPFVAGWGTTSERGMQSPVLLHVQVPIIPNDECREKYRNIGKLKTDDQFSSYVICAGHALGGADSCQGDSGGPLMLPVHQDGKFPFYQIGVVSYGIGCARPNIPGVYANIQHYADWIKQNVFIPKHKL